MNSIFVRRSVRKFTDKKVEKSKIEKLLRAAMQAPSAANGQPWEFIVVEGSENLNLLSQLSPYAWPVKNSPLAVVITGNKKRTMCPENLEQDLGAATQNLLLEAVELGLGAVWLGVTPVKERMKYVKKLYNLTDTEPYCVIAVGYPEACNVNVFVDRFDESRITYVES